MSLWLSLSDVQDSVIVYLHILVITFLILSGINSGLLQSDNVQPYTDQVKSQLEVSPISHTSKREF